MTANTWPDPARPGVPLNPEGEVPTDELVRRLQHLGDWQAADRIKALQKRVAELEGAVIQCRSLTKFLKPQADRIAELEGALITAQNMLSEMGISSAEKCQMAYDYLREANAALTGGKDE